MVKNNIIRSKEIYTEVYELLLNAPKYSVWDIQKVTLVAGIKTYNAVAKALMKLELDSKLQEIMAFEKLGGNRVMVRK